MRLRCWRNFRWGRLQSWWKRNPTKHSSRWGKACEIGWPDLKQTISILVPVEIGFQKKSTALFDTYAALSPADAQRAVQFIRTNASRNTKGIRELVQSDTFQRTHR